MIFTCDLDNTLIYSYKHDIGQNKQCVEIYQGREISFMTSTSYRGLKEANERLLFVPTTTRTTEQYSRIDLGIERPKYALVCNGGVLLCDGIRDEAWYRASLKMVEDCREQMDLGVRILQADACVNFEVRNIDGLFLFTKSEKPEESMDRLREKLDLDKVEIRNQGVKVYVLPKVLNKGYAITRLKERLNGDFLIAAGDSGFDVTMLQCADKAFLPPELAETIQVEDNMEVIGDGILFSDGLLERILDMR